MSDWVEDRLGVEDGEISPDLSVVFEVRRRDMWQRPYDTGLRVVGNDDQQIEIAGRKLLEGLIRRPIRFLFGFHLTRKHVMSAPTERPGLGI